MPELLVVEFCQYGVEPAVPGLGALLVAPDDMNAGSTAELIAAAGARLVARIAVSDVAMRLRQQGQLDLIVLDASQAPPLQLDAAAKAMAVFAEEAETRLVALVDLAQLDSLSATLMRGPWTVLCAPDAAELFAALTTALSDDKVLWLNDASRDSEAGRLQRLNQEVARIAETLARLTRDAASGNKAVAIAADRSIGYRPEPSDLPPPIDAIELRQMIRARRLRDQFFGDGLFEDPAWDMLLDLYAAALERTDVSVSSLCIAAAVAPTTALRWITRMTDAGLFERRPDPFDRRRAYMALSPSARQGMDGYFATIKRAAPARVPV